MKRFEFSTLAVVCFFSILCTSGFGQSTNSSSEYVVAAASSQYDVGGLLRMVLGKNYRAEWTTAFPIKMVLLDTLFGGLTPVKRGGGKQTTSLRLEDKTGRQFAMRSVNKVGTRTMPKELQNSFVADIVQDAVCAAHPYGALVIPKLAEAVGIYHVKPQLVYVPRQDALGAFNDDFAEQLYLLELRPNETEVPLPRFGHSEKIVGSAKLFEKLEKSWQHRVDQHALLRARLFDIWIGDWDRHKDNWRWAAFEEGELTIYRPIPRDRDKAFYLSDGLLGKVASIPYFSPTLRSFDEKINYLPGLHFNSKHLDRANLNLLSRQEFIDIARELQKLLTDELIDEAVGQLPPEIFVLRGAQISSVLKTRRQDLVSYAQDFYGFLAKSVDIVGTEDRELFDIHQLEEGGTRVSVHRLTKKGKIKGKMYERSFDKEETQEICLYGLQQRDSFVVSGEQLPAIKVRIVGGAGDDVVGQAFMKNKSKGRKLRLYDEPGGIQADLPKGMYKDKISSTDSVINEYQRYAFAHNKHLVYPLISRTPDDGFRFSLNFTNQTYKFKKFPYGSQNNFSVSYATGSKAIGVSYGGHFPQRLGSWDFRFGFKWDGPIYLQNYFGLGNNFDIESDPPLGFYRLRGSKVQITPTASKTLKKGHYFEYGPQFQYFNIERTEGRFITDSISDAPSNIFEAKPYINALAKYRFERLDKSLHPGRGWRWKLNASAYYSISDSDKKHLRFDAELSRFQPLLPSKKIVLATHLGAAVNLGEYELFHAAFLGSRSSLRGFYTNRYGGDALFYQQTDLRFILFHSTNNFMPIKMGMHLSFDYGRVWLGASDLDDNWHHSYGGGIYFIPLDKVIVRFSGFFVEEEFRFSFVTGMAF